MKLIVVPMKADSVTRRYVVGTFQDGKTIKPRGYLRDYNPSWDGCIEYQVYATSGKDAKRGAIEARIKEDKKTLYT